MLKSFQFPVDVYWCSWQAPTCDLLDNRRKEAPTVQENQNHCVWWTWTECTHLVSQHTLLLTDGRDHLVHLLRHLLQEPVGVLHTRGANGVALEHEYTQMERSLLATFRLYNNSIRSTFRLYNNSIRSTYRLYKQSLLSTYRLC